MDLFSFIVSEGYPCNTKCRSLLYTHISYMITTFYVCFFSVRLLSVLRGHSVFSSHNGQWPPTLKDFLSQMLSITFIFLSYFLRKSQYFPFWMFSAQQGHYWYPFITSLVWRGPCLWIEPGTPRTRSQHSSTRLSRRRSAKTTHLNCIYIVPTYSGYGRLVFITF